MRVQPRHRDRIRPILRKTFLGGLPEAAIETLLAKGRIKTYRKGTFIYRRGDPGDTVMVILKGRIGLGTSSDHGKETVHYYAGTGEIIGEVAALDGQGRAADGIASEETELFVISTRDVLPLLKAHPDAMFALARALCDKVRTAAAIIEDNMLDMQGRAARGLLRLARQHGRRNGDGAPLQLSISQKELGKYLGMSRANTNRQLGHFKYANIISVSVSRITIEDEEELARLAKALNQD